MKVPYNCMHSCHNVRDYYVNQAAHGLPVYSGVRFQKGHGFFSNLFRFAAPLLKKGATGLAKHLLKAGSNIVADVESGKTFGDSAKSRLREAGKTILKDTGVSVVKAFHGGARKGIKRKKRGKKASKSSKRRTISTRRKDIFG